MRRGYTLVELAVVLAMLLILAAVALPAFRRARLRAEAEEAAARRSREAARQAKEERRERARLRTCRDNFLVVSRAVLLYCEDYDGHAPDLVHWPAKGSQITDDWFTEVRPYIPIEGFFMPRCEGEYRSHPTRQWTSGLERQRYVASWPGPNGVHSGPGPPTPFFGEPRKQTDGRPRKFVPVADPARTIALAEVEATWWVVWHGNTPYERDPVKDHVVTDLLGERHKGRANFGFADGHVAMLPWRDVCCGSGGGKDKCPWSRE
ncbi:MAG: prepilin-type N-terminal cleavage/methylation domain-containing protein [Armatimonadetes bacterium]|nr:prepilin-type N-terminal cleavage/methylation domain-containing protein [Armatimonadota bacterium]